MTLKNKIKEAFRGSKDKGSKWSSDTQPNIYELDNFLRKSGYKLANIEAQSTGVPEIFIDSSEPLYLHPEIYHDLVEGKFTIKVDKHGLLEASDMEEIIKGYQNALAVVNYLDALDLKKLEVGE